MRPFQLIRPETLTAARERVTEDPTNRALRAGGIDLLDRMKEGLDAPAELVELRRLGDADLGPMRAIADGRIGALVTLAELADHAGGREHGALTRAAAEAATPGIRNTATVGGNLLQRPRCWYFRHENLVCLKKGGDACLAVAGDHRYNAILGGGPSFIVHPSSLATALLALDASVTTMGGKTDTRPLSELFVLPKEDPSREHRLEPGEILTAVTLPEALEGQRSAYRAAREKQSHDWPLAEAAVRLRVNGGKLSDVRVALGHVAPVPWRSEAAEKALEGKSPSTELFAEAAKAATADAKPLAGNAYKVPLVQGLLRHALHEATDTPLPA